MNNISLELNNSSAYLNEKYIHKAVDAAAQLIDEVGEGSDFLGWKDLPFNISEDYISEVKKLAAKFEHCKFVVCIGIGGSYLGAKAINAALGDGFSCYKDRPGKTTVLYAGNSLSEDYLFELCELLRGQEFGILNISKSGGTTEPAIAFRVLYHLLSKNVGEKRAAELVVAVTSPVSGALREMAIKRGFAMIHIPEDVGGRFSVLTAVGLLPIAIEGHNIDKLIEGARSMREYCMSPLFRENPSMQYAAVRNALYEAGHKIEILCSFRPKMRYIAEWWKQLFGESEGKDHKGIFPASADFSTDLHSIGQWIQDGERSIFETIISVDSTLYSLAIPESRENLDQLNYLSGKRLDEINKSAEVAVKFAHIDGSVPVIQIKMPNLDEYYLGQLIYFFEAAVAISGYMIGVNPFNQPGVEAYKVNMFALLGKKGYEAERQNILKRLKRQ